MSRQMPLRRLFFFLAVDDVLHFTIDNDAVGPKSPQSAPGQDLQCSLLVGTGKVPLSIIMEPPHQVASRSQPGLRMHGPGNCSNASAKRFLRECHPNSESRGRRQRAQDEDSREGNTPRQARNRPRWLRQVPRDLVRVNDRVKCTALTTRLSGSPWNGGETLRCNTV